MAKYEYFSNIPVGCLKSHYVRDVSGCTVVFQHVCRSLARHSADATTRPLTHTCTCTYILEMFATCSNAYLWLHNVRFRFGRLQWWSFMWRLFRIALCIFLFTRWYVTFCVHVVYSETWATRHILHIIDEKRTTPLYSCFFLWYAAPPPKK